MTPHIFFFKKKIKLKIIIPVTHDSSELGQGEQLLDSIS
jgi:hypothetical protein